MVPLWALLAQIGLLTLFVCSEHRKYSDTLTFHNGSQARSRSTQSGIYCDGRDRTKKAIIRRANKAKRALEEDSEEEDEIITPKKKVCSKVGHVGSDWR